MSEFLNSNEWGWRLLRTVAQGVLGVVVANVDLLMSCAMLDPTWRAVCVALATCVPVLLGSLLLVPVGIVAESLLGE